MSDVLYTMNDRSKVQGILCFECNHVSECIDGILPGEIKYIKNYKINSDVKSKFLDAAHRHGHENAITNINKIKTEQRISVFKLLIGFGVGYFLLFYLFK